MVSENMNIIPRLDLSISVASTTLFHLFLQLFQRKSGVMENPASPTTFTQNCALLLRDPFMKTIKCPTPTNHCNGGVTAMRRRLVFSALFYDVFCTLAALLNWYLVLPRGFG